LGACTADTDNCLAANFIGKALGVGASYSRTRLLKLLKLTSYHID